MKVIDHFEATENKDIISQAEDFSISREKLFDDFDFTPEEFRKGMTDYLYQQFFEEFSEEYKKEYETYSNPELYTELPYLGIEQGPNCYAFALKMTKNPSTGRPFVVRPFPGIIAHGIDAYDARYRDIINYGTPNEVKNILTSMMRDDLESQGMELTEIDSPDIKTGENEWVIAMAYSQNLRESSEALCDFHFYRRGECNTWFHKPGMSSVENQDASGKIITDPYECDRGIYDHFMGYFLVRDTLLTERGRIA